MEAANLGLRRACDLPVPLDLPLLSHRLTA